MIKLKNKSNIFYGFAIFVALLMIASVFLFPQSKIQIQILIGISLIYVFSSMVYHYFDKSLTFETTIEYIVIAFLVIIILMGAVL